jgi:hypothetical protein
MIAPALVSAGGCDEWPQGLVFVGLTDSGWQTYTVTRAGHKPTKIELNSEARTPVYASVINALVYVDEEGQVNLYSLKEQKAEVLLSPSKEAAYAQPEFDNENNALYVVKLKQGKSVDTDIVRLDLNTGKTKPMVIQRSAQFEPQLAHGWLYYSNVHCVVGCGKIIQEIWRYHTISGIAEQVTMLNNISRQPAVDEQNGWLYFSSNAAGNFHIYRLSFEKKNRSLEKLTKGAVTDLSPAFDKNRLYFIRHDAQGARMMCRNNIDGETVIMELPSGVTDIRDLEIN